MGRALCVDPEAASKKVIMARNGSESIQVLINHWRWLEANGYKQEAASCKQQAASLTAGPGYDRMDLERINYEQ